MKYAIVFGGVSFEHEISIVSAIALKDILMREKIYIFCDAEREFYLIPEEKMQSKLFSSGEYKKEQKLLLKNGGFYQKGMLKEKKADYDMVLNLVHGGDGEDGKLAALFTFFDIPFIGPRLEASVLSFNKLYTKWYAKELGIGVLDYEVLYKGEYNAKTPFPFIIKPLRLGSSIGVTIVRKQEELEYALDVAYEFDDAVLIEPFVEGVKEYNLAGCKGEDFVFSIVEEPQKEQFLDFEKKYLDFSRTERVHEAEIDENLRNALQEAFRKIYNTLFEGALIRCDFFVIDGNIYLNEINPIPGSYANYLFSDFSAVVEELSYHLPKERQIPIEYTYIHSIQKAKGK
ncbi:MAG TPA: D-alanine--D-alanine ligase [Campylobacteraceae bacterium]|nr:D-alanine--D-alanine ligase [Campylobacteraceae bacterium]